MLYHVIVPVQKGGVQLSLQPVGHNPEVVLHVDPILHSPHCFSQLSP